jgi:hypothetical protein
MAILAWIQQNPTAPPPTSLFSHDFANTSDGSYVNVVADTGQGIGIYQGPATVAGGFLDSPSTNALYPETNPGVSEITQLGAQWKFDSVGGTKTTSTMNLTLVIWGTDGYTTGGAGRQTRCHASITKTYIEFSVRDTESSAPGSLVSLGTQTISGGLADDALHTAEVTFSGTTATVTVNGTGYSWTDSRIAHYSGQVFACAEPFYGGSGTTDRRVRIKKMWADGVPLPATPLMLGKTDLQGSVSTTRTIVVPSGIKAGDILVVATTCASGSITQTISGLTFSMLGSGNQTFTRAAQSSTIWYRSATPSDVGTTLTVTMSSSVSAPVQLLILRNVASIGGYLTPVPNNTQLTAPQTMSMLSWTPSSSTIPLDLITLGRSAASLATMTPPSSVTALTQYGASATFVAGFRWGWNPTPNTAIGNDWVDSSNHIWSGFRITLNV